MRFTEEQEHFRQELRRFADSHCKTLAQRDALTEGGTIANSPEMFRKIADHGWFGVSLPEEYGGHGAGMVDECIFLEETARGLVPIKGDLDGLRRGADLSQVRQRRPEAHHRRQHRRRQGRGDLAQ